MSLFAHNAYTGLAEPYSFGGRGQVLRHFRGLPAEKILDKLYSISSYTQFRQAKAPSSYNPIYAKKRRELMQADLIDMQQLSGSNGGVRHIFMCIDTFSKKLFARLLKNKEAATTLHAFRDMLREMQEPPERLGTDGGTEFLNPFSAFADANNIKLERPRHKYGGVERVNLTLQRLLYMYMNEFNTKRYVDIFNDAVKVYNNRIHRIIQMTPNQADLPANRGKVLSKLLRFYHRKKKKPKLSVGDIVRVQKPRTGFSRGYKEHFYPGFYRVSEINTRMPIPMYIISDLSNSGAKVMRSFYENELQKYSSSRVKAKKTGRTRINEALGGVREIEVVLEGFPHKYFVQESKLKNWLGQ